MQGTISRLRSIIGYWKYPVAVTSLLLLSRARIADTPKSHKSENTEIKQDLNKLSSGNSSVEIDDMLELRKADAFWGLFIGDAISMPVHWYYNPSDIRTGYGGWLTGYRAPNKRHPSSILTISSTDGSGRVGWSAKAKPLIGDVILHDKLKYWQSGDRSTHYHQGMAAGDNTLNALTALETMKVMQKFDQAATMDPQELRAQVMENYVKFMSTPGSHPDTYAESFHRSFFKDWSEEENPPRVGNDILAFCDRRYKFAERTQEDSQMAQMGALVLTVPWIIHYAHLDRDDCIQRTVEATKLTHPSPSLVPFVKIYASALYSVINGQDLHKVAQESISSQNPGGNRKERTIMKCLEKANKFSKDSESRLEVFQDGVSSLGLACYIDGALSSLFLLALGFHDDFSGGVLTNANCGGENAHRGAALGALLAANGVNTGAVVSQSLKDGLNYAKPTIQQLVQHKL